MQTDTPRADTPQPGEREELRPGDIEAARALVNRLCKDGERAWRMCIPPQSDDSDMLLTRVIDAAERLTVENERLRAESALRPFDALYALRDYAFHAVDCPDNGYAAGGGAGACVCGLDEAWRAAVALLPPLSTRTDQTEQARAAYAALAPLVSDARGSEPRPDAQNVLDWLDGLAAYSDDELSAEVDAEMAAWDKHDRMEDALIEIADWEKPPTISYREAYDHLRAAAHAALAPAQEVTNCRCRECLDARQQHVPIEERTTTTQMIVCPECGNKRCPRAGSHRYACIHSNDGGAVGSPLAPAQEGEHA